MCVVIGEYYLVDLLVMHSAIPLPAIEFCE
jgi:hypothetical protein